MSSASSPVRLSAARSQPIPAEPKKAYAIGCNSNNQGVFHVIGMLADTGAVTVPHNRIVTLSDIPIRLQMEMNVAAQITGQYRQGDHDQNHILIAGKIYPLFDFADVGIRMMLGAPQLANKKTDKQ